MHNYWCAERFPTLYSWFCGIGFRNEKFRLFRKAKVRNGLTILKSSQGRLFRATRSVTDDFDVALVALLRS